MECFGYIRGRTAVHNLGNVNGSNCTGEVGFLLCAVTYDYELVEKLGGRLEINAHVMLGCHSHGFVSDRTDSQRSTGFHLDGEVTEGIGRDALRRTLRRNTCTNDRVIVFIIDCTAEGDSRLTLRLRLGIGQCEYLSAERQATSQQQSHKKMFSHKVVVLIVTLTSVTIPFRRLGNRHRG